MVDVTNGNALDEIDLWENIEAIKKQCNIDTTRISLIGSCESSYYALRIGTQYPERIAAMALVSPRLAENKSDNNPWLMQQNPLNILNNCWNIPILNIHSKLDEHTQIVNSYYLNALMKKGKATNYVYRELPLDFEPYYIDEYIKDLVEFNLKHSLSERSSDEVRFTSYLLKNSSRYWFDVTQAENIGQKITVHARIKNNRLEIESENVKRFRIKLSSMPYNPKEKLVIVQNNNVVYEDYATGNVLDTGTQDKNHRGIEKNSLIEGPFVHAFLQPFVIVPGTMGNQKENDLNMTVATRLVEMWDTMYYTKCRMMEDKNITANEIRNCNLILIGNEHNNRIFKQYSSSLPIKSTNNSLEINHETFQGVNLNYYLVYPNPTQPNKYLAVLGYNNADRFQLASEGTPTPLANISHFGFYDYKIWEPINCQIIKSGYFNHYWDKDETSPE